MVRQISNRKKIEIEVTFVGQKTNRQIDNELCDIEIGAVERLIHNSALPHERKLAILDELIEIYRPKQMSNIPI